MPHAGEQMATATDPVCKKPLERDDVVARVEYGGRTYEFCSDDCRQQFEESPAQYLAHEPTGVCGACGAPISQEDLFCPTCGTSLIAG